MRIILVTDYFYPISNGGTEKYIYLLAKYLPTSYKVSILSISETLSSTSYDGLQIDYIKPNSDGRRDVIKGLLPPNNIKEFESFILTKSPDIVHFHTLTTNFNEYHYKICFDLGIFTYFTSHIPGHICLRGDLMLNGKEACDGKISNIKCGFCQAKSIESSSIKILKRALFNIFSKNSPVKIRKQQLKKIQESTTKIITVSEWQKQFLTENGIKAENIEVCRQTAEDKEIDKNISKQQIRLGYLGRIDPIKGLHLLIKSIIALNTEISLNIAAVSPPKQFMSYHHSLEEMSKLIPNCNWQFDLDENQIRSFFADIDYLVVPSLCFETGPFVIYEALANKTPIIATNLGGQKELIQEGLNGYLFEPNGDKLINLLKKITKEPVLTVKDNSPYNLNSISVRMQEIYTK